MARWDAVTRGGASDFNAPFVLYVDIFLRFACEVNCPDHVCARFAWTVEVGSGGTYVLCFYAFYECPWNLRADPRRTRTPDYLLHCVLLSDCFAVYRMQTSGAFSQVPLASAATVAETEKECVAKRKVSIARVRVRLTARPLCEYVCMPED